MAVIAVFLLVLLLDQLTKWWAQDFLSRGRAVEVVGGFFRLHLVKNPGAAFGIFPHRPSLFIILSLLIIGGVVYYYRRVLSRGPMLKAAVGLVLGGAVGNLIDRLRFSHVIDFLDFYLGPHHWPAFNVADSAICVGVGLLILATLRQGSPKKEDAPDPV